MHDLNTIISLNERATKDAIPKFVEQGFHVLAKYAGLHFIDFSKHGTAEEAEEAKREYLAVSPDRRATIHSPQAVAA